ncbi:MAG: hypothetical protein IT340_11100, partial [Chloroflexi bacterium]|nr:hypothetical protein [Chloroflexota bacterium]
MGQASQPIVNGAVEGPVDEAVARRLLVHVGASPGTIYGKNGKQHVLDRLAGFNNAARLAPWLVLVDLDTDAVCAPTARALWLPQPAPSMCFRIAVREIEAWLLADRERLAQFLGIPLGRMPSQPEAIPDPKRTPVDLARRSRRRDIVQDLVPRPTSGRTVGPAYTSRLIEYVTDTKQLRVSFAYYEWVQSHAGPRRDRPPPATRRPWGSCAQATRH